MKAHDLNADVGNRKIYHRQRISIRVRVVPAFQKLSFDTTQQKLSKAVQPCMGAEYLFGL